MSAPRTGRRGAGTSRVPQRDPDERRSPRRELGDTLKKAAIWAFIAIFLTSILGVAFVSVSAR